MAEEARVPSMCLVCGAVVCSQSYCCQTSVDDGASTVGACTSHADRCGAGTGLFLRVRECKLVLLAGRGSKGCFYAPPYVDQGRYLQWKLDRLRYFMGEVFA